MAEPTPGTPLRRAQASRGQGLWVSADMFAERTSSLGEAQEWVVRRRGVPGMSLHSLLASWADARSHH